MQTERPCEGRDYLHGGSGDSYMGRRGQALGSQGSVGGGQHLHCERVVAPGVQVQHLKQQPHLQDCTTSLLLCCPCTCCLLLVKADTDRHAQAGCRRNTCVQINRTATVLSLISAGQPTIQMHARLLVAVHCTKSPNLYKVMMQPEMHRTILQTVVSISFIHAAACLALCTINMICRQQMQISHDRQHMSTDICSVISLSMVCKAPESWS